MKILKIVSLNQVKKPEAEWCVSIYLPVSPVEVQVNRTRLRDLMFAAEKKLLELGTSIITVAKMLLPIERILDDNSFWKDPEKGVGIFLTPTLFKQVSIPYPVEAILVVSHKFYLTPLDHFGKSGFKAKVQSLIESENFSSRVVRPVHCPGSGQ